MQGWTSHIADALLRTPRGATPLHRDKWTMVADSTAEGYGLYAAKKLPAGFVLYAYSGVERSSAEAAGRPNAYQFELKAGKVCDGSNQKVASAARYVNTQGAYAKDNNCLFKEHQGTVYLVTIKDIQRFEELFASMALGMRCFQSGPWHFWVTHTSRLMSTRATSTSLLQVTQSACHICIYCNAAAIVIDQCQHCHHIISA